MFSRLLALSLNSAYSQARQERHEFITVEHLLLALLDNPEVSDILVACHADIERLRSGLTIFINETVPRIDQSENKGEAQPALSLQRVLQKAIYQAQMTSSVEITGSDVLLAILSESESQAVYFLSQENVSRVDIMNYVIQSVSKENPKPENINTDQRLFIDSSTLSDTPSKDNLLEIYAVNLNQKAIQGELDPLIGRQEELNRCIQVLCRRSKNNPLFVGEAGVGKTALVNGLVQCIVNHRVPEILLNTTVYALDLGVLLAGTKYRGDFEKRFKSVLKALQKKNGAIVFIDEIHNLVGAGAAMGGTMDAANLIKPILSANELRCIGATTYKEYRNFIAKDHALLRRFRKIDVIEPSTEETINILEKLKPQFEKYHHLHYTHNAIQRAVELSARYMSERQLPDKAIDVIDEAGAYQHLQSFSQRREVIDVCQVEEVISRMSRIPIQRLSNSQRGLVKYLPEQLKKVIFGQDEAIEILTDTIKLSTAGLRDKNKPLGAFLFAGPTGVGKTELTYQLAEKLGVKLIRIDMSEYMEKHAVSRLIGAPPGYVGYDEGGLLTESIVKHPHSILLLDEVEKAHPDLFNLLLQVMDYGRLTDNNGNKVDFRHVMVIMTTNAGADQMDKNTLGFAEQTHEEDSLHVIKQMFPPEFRNRLDGIVQFKSLASKTILRVVNKFTQAVEDQLKEKNIRLVLSKAAQLWLAQKGYDRKMGARPMERVISEYIKKPLADEMLFGRLLGKKASTVWVDLVDNKPKIYLKASKHTAMH